MMISDVLVYLFIVVIGGVDTVETTLAGRYDLKISYTAPVDERGILGDNRTTSVDARGIV